MFLIIIHYFINLKISLLLLIFIIYNTPQHLQRIFMKKIILLSATTSAMLLATNGDIMLRDGAKASGMGGVGIAISHGSESLYSNPAMIKDVKGSEFSGYLTMFQPDVQFSSDASARIPQGAASKSKSDADRSFIPGFAYVHRNNDHVVWGISVAGTAGMGTDYNDVAKAGSGAFGMETQLAIAKISVPIAYTVNDLTIAVAPVLQYSTLEMNYDTPFGRSTNEEDSSVGFGLAAGLAYDIGSLTLGAEFKSKIETNYKNNISSAVRDFGIASVTSGDQLDQPAEFGIGAAYRMGNSVVAIDLRRVNWGEVAGYKDFGWENQNVVAVGYEYATPSWAVRAGYNYGKSPITEQDGSATANAGNYANAAKNFFNLAGFPAMVEEHYTVGGDYTVSDNLAMTLAFVYTPEETNSFNTSDLTNGQIAQGGGIPSTATASTATVNHSQSAVTVGATYKF
ncbi:MAG: putative facilitator of salicylate uptake [uncultured Sulfurovum sp.]|uniref:Putative facilitator of salicylate uptake n=1 Tax=uncultured Sulfurovum sp. TaxID=269237 RepID=A0A6S6S1B2_9BACT|nr:MAG: putative facilitator of salicylate uptake [uncultured Sulfurovum sp.]